MGRSQFVLLTLAALVLGTTGCSRSGPRQALRGPLPPPATATTRPEEKEEAGDASGALEFFLKKRLPPGATKLPVERYTTAREHISQMLQYSIAGREYRALSGNRTPELAAQELKPLGTAKNRGQARTNP